MNILLKLWILSLFIHIFLFIRLTGNIFVGFFDFSEKTNSRLEKLVVNNFWFGVFFLIFTCLMLELIEN